MIKNKLNKKGFLLAEAIVAAVFVLGMVTLIAINMFPLFIKYENTLSFDNPSEVYYANIFCDELKADGKTYNTDVHALLSNISTSSYYSQYTKRLKEILKIKNIYVHGPSGGTTNISSFSRGLKTYYTYLKKKDSSIDSKAYLLFEFENGKFARVGGISW